MQSSRIVEAVCYRIQLSSIQAKFQPSFRKGIDVYPAGAGTIVRSSSKSEDAETITAFDNGSLNRIVHSSTRFIDAKRSTTSRWWYIPRRWLSSSLVRQIQLIWRLLSFHAPLGICARWMNLKACECAGRLQLHVHAFPVRRWIWQCCVRKSSSYKVADTPSSPRVWT